jgi:hypothetical protein
MKYDHFSMLPERAFQPRNGRNGMTLEGGGGGGPTQTTTYTSNVPEWLRPQTEALLGSATQEYFQTEKGPDGTYNITGLKPYVPYSSDPRDYVAPFSPQQQQVMYETSMMQRPGGFGFGQQMTGQAGMGGFESAGGAYDYGRMGAGYGAAGAQLGTQGGAQYGGLGAGYGAMGAGLAPEAQMYGRSGADIGMMGLRAESLGRDVGEEARQYARQAASMGGMYERMATDPSAIQAYMSPYQQSVTDIAKQQAIDDAQRTQLSQNLAAARQGTYGGGRQAVLQGQREASLQKQLSDIQSQGLQNAFQQAQQAQQFGVTTGLQGLQGAQAGLGTALQGGQLGLSGIGQAVAGQQAGLAGLGQAGQLYGLGMQGAGMGLQGVQQQLAGTEQGMRGAGVGLQGVQGAQAGYGLAGQMGRSMADISAQQQQSDIARMQFQQQIASLPQEQQQKIIDQAIQNYAIAQESPFQRLSQYSGLLRGYSTPTMTAESYRAGTAPAQTLAALGTAAYGASLPGRKEGGVIEEGIDTLAIKKAKRKKVAA